MGAPHPGGGVFLTLTQLKRVSYRSNAVRNGAMLRRRWGIHRPCGRRRVYGCCEWFMDHDIRVVCVERSV